LSKLDSHVEPDVVVEVAVDDDVVVPPEAKLCKAPTAPDTLDCTPVPADVPQAALTVADWLAKPAELVV
jgi:hypothetical protein